MKIVKKSQKNEKNHQKTDEKLKKGKKFIKN